MAVEIQGGDLELACVATGQADGSLKFSDEPGILSDVGDSERAITGGLGGKLARFFLAHGLHENAGGLGKRTSVKRHGENLSGFHRGFQGEG